MQGDEKLIRQVLDRDVSAMEALYNRYAPSFLSLCYRYCGNRDDAEDILHDGFIKIIGNIAGFRIRPGSSFEGWMKRIMVNTALNFIRDRAKEKKFIDIDPIADRLEVLEEEEEDGDSPYLEISQEKVMELICTLPPGYRTVFNLYVFENYLHKEIASLLGYSENTSKSQLSKARIMLRKKINQLAAEQKPVDIYEKT